MPDETQMMDQSQELDAPVDSDPAESAAAESGEQEQELSPELIAELRTLIKKFAQEEMPSRRNELMRAREARAFWRGHQYNAFSADSGTFAVPFAGGLPSLVGGEQGENNRFYYVTNIYTPMGKSMISALTGTVPAVRFIPDSPENIDDIDGCNEAEKYRKYFYSDVNVDQLMKDTARFAWTDGRTLAWIKQVTNELDEGVEGKPRVRETAELFGVLETKVPISLRSMRAFPALQISYEESVAKLKDDYPDKIDKIKENVPGPGEDSFDRICRLSVMQDAGGGGGGGDTYAHLATIQHTFLRPCAFTGIKDKAKREELQKRFKKGARVCYIGTEFIEAVEDDMDKSIALFLPTSGDGMACSSLGEFLIPVAKRINNLGNLIQETYEREVPGKFADSKAIDVDAMADGPATPGQWITVKRPPNTPLGDLFYKEQPSLITGDMIGVLNDLKGSTAQMVSSVQPSIFGGSMVNSKTAAVYSQARDQALGSLAITYGPLKTFLARIVELAANLAKSRDGDISGMVPDDQGSYVNLSVKVDALKKGSYFCRPEVDEGFPESYSQQRQNFMTAMQFMGQNPQFMALMQDPTNQYLFGKFLGVKGFKVGGADERNVQLHEIKQLLMGTVIPPDQADMQKIAVHQTLTSVAGHPSPEPDPEDLEQSSVPIDVVYDDHKIHFATVKDWIISDEGQQAKQLNPRGFQNVRLHGIEHQRVSSGGPDGAKPMQDNIPDPAKQIQAAQANAAIQDHAQEGQQPMMPPPGTPDPNGGPPPPTPGV